MKYKILIDTNFFFIPFYENFDILEELKRFLVENNIEFEGFYTLKKNIYEIENKIKISKSVKKKKLYELVMEYINKNNIIILESSINEKTDRLLINIALNGNWIVCTLDKQLKSIMKKLKIPYISYSNKKLYIKW
ncbi:MAG: hypothetical protein QXI77_00670 [Nanopusillaceae archaeon]